MSPSQVSTAKKRTNPAKGKGRVIVKSDAERKRIRDRLNEAMDAAQARIPKRGHSPREAAAALGVSLATVNRGIYEGQIPSTKILGRRVVSDETITALLAGEDPAGAEPIARTKATAGGAQ